MIQEVSPVNKDIYGKQKSLEPDYKTLAYRKGKQDNSSSRQVIQWTKNFFLLIRIDIRKATVRKNNNFEFSSTHKKPHILETKSASFDCNTMEPNYRVGNFI